VLIRRLAVGVLVLCFVGLGACRRHHDRNPDDRSAARQAGREAYKLSQETKRLADQARHQLRQASKEARQGWNDAKKDQH